MGRGARKNLGGLAKEGAIDLASGLNAGSRIPDIEQPEELRSYLGTRPECRSLLSGGRTLADVEITPLHGGVSNKTVLVRFDRAAQWVLKQALSKLRVAVDWYASPERVHREAAGMTALAELLAPGSVPRLVFEDRAAMLLAMEAVPAPHENWKQALLSGRVVDDHVAQFADLLSTLHRRSADASARYRSKFADRSFFETLRLEPYYEFTAARTPAAARFIEELIARTRAVAVSLVHGDFSPKNILVHAGRLVLLDHEVIHFGDPAFDVGFALTHLLSKAHHVSVHRGRFVAAARAWWERYAAAVGGRIAQGDFERRAAAHALACLLSRVRGRSPLEYLTPQERDRQAAITLELMSERCSAVDELIDRFADALDRRRSKEGS